MAPYKLPGPPKHPRSREPTAVPSGHRSGAAAPPLKRPAVGTRYSGAAAERNGPDQTELSLSLIVHNLVVFAQGFSDGQPPANRRSANETSRIESRRRISTPPRFHVEA
ncbi:hypothetical protein TgHK011_001939 [Trichoderma gracile]|nr:hypothetical protein TgHK011_001939 [Trichoderma gracile]